jgi:hypothetical protein
LQQGTNYSLKAGYDEAPVKLRLQIAQKQDELDLVCFEYR